MKNLISTFLIVIVTVFQTVSAQNGVVKYFFFKEKNILETRVNGVATGQYKLPEKLKYVSHRGEGEETAIRYKDESGIHYIGTWDKNLHFIGEYIFKDLKVKGYLVDDGLTAVWYTNKWDRDYIGTFNRRMIFQGEYEITGAKNVDCDVKDRKVYLTYETQSGIPMSLVFNEKMEKIQSPGSDQVNSSTVTNNTRATNTYQKLHAVEDNAGKIGFANTQGNLVIPYRYDKYKLIGEKLIGVKEGENWGVIDHSGKVVITPKYDDIDEPKEGMSLITALENYNMKFGFMNEDGVIVIPPIYDDAMFFSEGLAHVKQNNLYGYINKSGNVVIPFQYGTARNFNHHHIAIVEKYGKYGAIDMQGNVVIPLEFERLYSFDRKSAPNLAVAKKNGMYGIINPQGQTVLPFQYSYISDFEEGMAKITVNKKNGFIDDRGHIAIPPRYDDATDFENGFSKVKLGEFYGIIDRFGSEVIPMKYQEITKPVNGISVAKRDGKYGFVNTNGKEISAMYYDGFSIMFSKGRLRGFTVQSAIKFALFDTNGKKVTPFKYDEIEYVEEAGVFRFRVAGKFGALDITGKEIIPGQYTVMNRFGKGNFMASKFRKYGIIDTQGNEILPIIYEEIKELKEDRALFAQYGKIGFLDSTGKIIVPPKYTSFRRDYFKHGEITVQYENEWIVVDKNGNYLRKAY